MPLRNAVDVRNIDRSKLVNPARRDAERLPPGPGRVAEVVRVLACETLARIANSFQTESG
jgi:hypothetical protein